MSTNYLLIVSYGFISKVAVNSIIIDNTILENLYKRSSFVISCSFENFWQVFLLRVYTPCNKASSTPSANSVAEAGLSRDPIGVEGDRVPTLDVGEY